MLSFMMAGAQLFAILFADYMRGFLTSGSPICSVDDPAHFLFSVFFFVELSLAPLVGI